MSSESAAEPAYRSELETLRAENERLRTELSALQELTDNDPRMPLASWDAGCRLCGVKFANKEKNEYTTTMAYEPAYNPSWFARLFGWTEHPNRVKRVCRHCHGCYWEMPAEKKFQ